VVGGIFPLVERHCTRLGLRAYIGPDVDIPAQNEMGIGTNFPRPIFVMRTVLVKTGVIKMSGHGHHQSFTTVLTISKVIG
jgi:hypothetical protein